MSIVIGKYVCKNRKTKSLIERVEVVSGFYENHTYIVRCVAHNVEHEIVGKSKADYAMRTPWDWCAKCFDYVNKKVE